MQRSQNLVGIQNIVMNRKGSLLVKFLTGFVAYSHESASHRLAIQA